MNISHATPGSRTRTSPAHRHPVPIGQPDIQHRHIGAQRHNRGQRGRCGIRLADHPDVRPSLQQGAHPLADDLVIVQDEHADRLSGRITGRLVTRRA